MEKNMFSFVSKKLYKLMKGTRSTQIAKCDYINFSVVTKIRCYFGKM